MLFLTQWPWLILAATSAIAEARDISIPWPTIRPMLGWQRYDGQLLIDRHFLAENDRKTSWRVGDVWTIGRGPPNQKEAW